MSRHTLLTILYLFFLPTALQADETVKVQLDTTAGPIQLELYPDRAPLTVGNFLAHVDGGHYVGATFYRTVTFENDRGNPWIQVIQGGRGDADSPFSPIRHESTAETGLKHEDGTISMARGDVGTASSEFFICIGDQPALDHGADRNADRQGFAAFGRVIRGMPTVRRIHGMAAEGNSSSDYTRGQILSEPVEITAAYRLEDER